MHDADYQIGTAGFQCISLLLRSFYFIFKSYATQIVRIGFKGGFCGGNTEETNSFACNSFDNGSTVVVIAADAGLHIFQQRGTVSVSICGKHREFCGLYIGKQRVQSIIKFMVAQAHQVVARSIHQGKGKAAFGLCGDGDPG